MVSCLATTDLVSPGLPRSAQLTTLLARCHTVLPLVLNSPPCWTGTGGGGMRLGRRVDRRADPHTTPGHPASATLKYQPELPLLIIVVVIHSTNPTKLVLCSASV